MNSLSDLLQIITGFLDSFFNSMNSGFKLFFNDLPAIFGLSIGWWFVLFSILGLIVSYITGGEDD